MHNIKKIGIRILLIVAVITMFEMGVRYAYESYSATVIYTNREKSQMAGTIDTLYCGPSTIQRGIDVDVADKILSTTSFNISSSLQPIDGTYFLMKDMVKDNPVKTVFLGVSSDAAIRKETGTKWKALVYDRLDGFEDKMAYLLGGVSVDEWPYLMLYSLRVDDFFDYKTVKENLTQKQTEEFKQGKTAGVTYGGRGTFRLRGRYKGDEATFIKKGDATFSCEKVQEQYLSYLYKHLEYCQANDIEVILIYPPLTGDRIEQYGDITPMHDYYVGIAKKYQVPFWDFNYYKEIKNTFTNEYFDDAKHLNEKGNVLFTEELAKIYQKYQAGEDVSQFFAEECPYYTAQ